MRVVSAHDILTTRNCPGQDCENDQPHDHPLCSLCQTAPPRFTLDDLGPEPRCGATTLAGHACRNYPQIGRDHCGQHRTAS